NFGVCADNVAPECDLPRSGSRVRNPFARSNSHQYLTGGGTLASARRLADRAPLGIGRASLALSPAVGNSARFRKLHSHHARQVCAAVGGKTPVDGMCEKMR